MNTRSAQQADPSVLGALVDEIYTRLQNGQEIDVDQLAADFPEYRDRLRRMIPMLTELNSLDWPIAEQHYPADELRTAEQKTLGDFRILRQIGRGGMGVVYEAQQLTINRKVALKILPLAALVDSRALQRFKNEVTAIATLEHSHIVSVYSVGEDRGIHYFAMQLIRGQSLAAVIHELCSRAQRDGTVTGTAISDIVSDMSDEVEKTGSHDVNKVGSYSPEEVELDETAPNTIARGQSITAAAKITDQNYFRNVVHLILQAADALQHAHEHGIVHRDVKPGNLLLDTHGSLFVTDFGLARIETEAGVTMTGDVLGTLRYMSPEQLLGNRLVIDYRTDIYSLGATLYELLTLQPIWSSGDKAELIRQISFEEPTHPRKLNPSIPTDLETIVLKAISKNTDDRYDSSTAFADDLQSFLDHKPIVARRPTTVQRVAKWTRRNPAIMWSTMAVLAIGVIALSLGVVGLSVSRSMIAKERERAEENFRQARATVDTYLTKVSEDQLLNQPGMQPLRKELLELALEYYKQFIEQQPDDPGLNADLADAYERVGNINKTIGSLQDVLNAHQKALKIREELVARHPANLDYLQNLGKSLQNIGWSHKQMGRNGPALKYYREAITIQEPLLDQNSNVKKYRDHLFFSYHNLAIVQIELGQTEKALALYGKVIEIQERLVDQNPEVAQYGYELALTYGDLAVVHHVRGRQKSPMSIEHREEALALLEKAITILELLVDQDSNVSKYQDGLALSYHNLASVHSELGQKDKAVAALGKTITIRELLADQDPMVLSNQFYLSGSYLARAVHHSKLGETDEAMALSKKAITICERLVDEDPFAVDRQVRLTTAHTCVASALHRSGQTERAIASWEEAIKTFKNRPVSPIYELPKYQAEEARLYYNLAMGRRLSGQTDEALALVERAITIWERFVDQQFDVSNYRSNLVDAYVLQSRILLDLGDEEAAAAVLTKKLIGFVEKLASEEIPPAQWGHVGRAHYNLGNWQNARESLEKGIELRGETEPALAGGPRWWYLTMTLHQLGEIEQARTYYDQLVKQLEQNPSTRKIRSLRTVPAVQSAALRDGLRRKQYEYRIEAADVLGIEIPIEDKPDPTTGTGTKTKENTAPSESG